MTVKSWRCPNCSANMSLHAEEGVFRCPYCSTVLTVGDVTELVQRAREKADKEAAVRTAPPPAEPLTVEKTARPRGGVLAAIVAAARWALGTACVLWITLLLMVLLFGGQSFYGMELVALGIMMLPAVAGLVCLYTTGKHRKTGK